MCHGILTSPSWGILGYHVLSHGSEMVPSLMVLLISNRWISTSANLLLYWYHNYHWKSTITVLHGIIAILDGWCTHGFPVASVPALSKSQTSGATRQFRRFLAQRFFFLLFSRTWGSHLDLIELGTANIIIYHIPSGKWISHNGRWP